MLFKTLKDTLKDRREVVVDFLRYVKEICKLKKLWHHLGDASCPKGKSCSPTSKLANVYVVVFKFREYQIVTSLISVVELQRTSSPEAKFQKDF